MSFIDGMKSPTKYLPQYTRWTLPLTPEQLEVWTHLALVPVPKNREVHDYRFGMPVITSWVDQRTQNKERRYNAKHRALGLCLQCPEPAGPSSKSYCERCHAWRMEYQRRYRALSQKS